MKEYLLLVLAASMLFAACSFLSYRQGERSVTLALSVLVLAAVVLPLGELVSSLPEADFDFEADVTQGDGDYERVAEAAFCEGVIKTVSSEFSIEEENLRAYCVGFDFEKMRCKCLTVRVQGSAVFSDFDAIKKFLSENLGGCEVEVVIG